MSQPTTMDLSRMQARADDAASLLKTLGNPQRLRLLCLLVDREMSVGQLNEQVPELSQSALSQHLARLRAEGLVHTRRESQSIWYSLADGPAQQVIATLYGIYCAPDARMCGTKTPRARRKTRDA